MTELEEVGRGKEGDGGGGGGEEKREAVVFVVQFPLPIRRVFMLQHILYHHSTFIPTIKGSMKEDRNPSLQVLSASAPSVSLYKSLEQAPFSRSSLSTGAVSQD